MRRLNSFRHTQLLILTPGGALTHEYLKRHHDPVHARLGTYCYFIGQIHEDALLDETHYIQVSQIEEADFILVTSVEKWYENIHEYTHLLENARALHLPLLCADPDLYYFQQGTLVLRAGSLAKAYEDLGGTVIYHGKPYPDIFMGILKKYAHIPSHKILLIGNSIKTDYQSTITLGIDFFLVAGELTAYEMGLEPFSSFEMIVHRLKKLGYTPNHVAPGLYWD